MATLPGHWRYRVSAGTGWPDVSLRCLGETESLICNFYLNVAARTTIGANPSVRYSSVLLGVKQASKQPTTTRLWPGRKALASSAGDPGMTRRCLRSSQGPYAPQGSQSETWEVKPTFEVCTSVVLDSIKLLTTAHVPTVNRRSKF